MKEISMKEIYHNMKILTLIILISAVCVNLRIVEGFFWIFIILNFFFCSFRKWKIKKLTYKKEEKYFLLMAIPLSLLFDFLIKKETTFNIPMFYIVYLIAALIVIIGMKIIEYIKSEKENTVK